MHEPSARMLTIHWSQRISVRSPRLVDDVVGGGQQRAVQGDDVRLLQQLLLGDVGDAQRLERLIFIQIMRDHLRPEALHLSEHTASTVTAPCRERTLTALLCIRLEELPRSLHCARYEVGKVFR